MCEQGCSRFPRRFWTTRISARSCAARVHLRRGLRDGFLPRLASTGNCLAVSYVAMANGFTQHPKVMDLHDRAFRVHMAALDYCSSNLTDGHVSARGVKVVAAIVNTHPRRWVTELVDAGLWRHDPAGDGFWIHDYLVHNPSAAALKQLRDKRRQAGIRGAEKRWGTDGSSNDTGDDTGDGKSHDAGQIPEKSREEKELTRAVPVSRPDSGPGPTERPQEEVSQLVNQLGESWRRIA